MSKNQKRYLLRTLKTIDIKCDRILSILNVMHGDSQDSMLESIKESARDIYLCSLEERRRTGGFISILKHD